MPFIEVSAAERDILERAREPEEEPAHRGFPPDFDESARPWGQAPPPNPPTVTRLVDPAAWVEKQLRNLQAVGEVNYREGITRPKRDPIAAGIAAQGAYEAKMRDPAVLARRADGLRRTNMEEWARVSEELGATNLVRGVLARRFKVERAVSAYHGLLSQHLQRIDAMANTTDADREQRMVANLKGLRAMKGKI